MNNEIKEMAQDDSTIALFRLILDAMEEAAKNGVDAKEVWLGPFELRVLQRNVAWRRLFDEGRQIMGLRVRAAVSDGVRVGTSYEPTGRTPARSAKPP